MGNIVIACVELERLLAESPHVLMVPLAIGAQERSGVYNFHRDYFLAQLTADIAPIRSR